MAQLGLMDWLEKQKKKAASGKLKYGLTGMSKKWMNCTRFALEAYKIVKGLNEKDFKKLLKDSTGEKVFDFISPGPLGEALVKRKEGQRVGNGAGKGK